MNSYQISMCCNILILGQNFLWIQNFLSLFIEKGLGLVGGGHELIDLTEDPSHLPQNGCSRERTPVRICQDSERSREWRGYRTSKPI